MIRVMGDGRQGSTSTLVRVVIADDHPLMVDALRDRLSSSDAIRIVGTASNGDDLLRLVRSARPDVVVVDNRMPDRTGVECVRDIVEAAPDTRVLILSAYSEPDDVVAALDAGAAGYVNKSVTGAELIRSVLEVAGGGFWFDQRSAVHAVRALRERELRPARQRLSGREVEVLRLLATGGSNKDIARSLSVSVETVKTYVERIFAKLGVRDRTAAVSEAIRSQLID